MKWISTKIKFPESGEQVLTACKNMNMKDGIWLYDLCRYYPNVGWENRVNWEEILYWKYIDKPKEERIMEQYIPKSALVEEIENRIKNYILLQQKPEMSDLQEELQNKIDCLNSIKGYILNTLEVKEVDLETELNKWRHNHFHGRRDKDASGEYLERISQLELAKHFFELGMRSTITEEDCKLIWNTGDEIPNMPEEEFFKELLRRYKAQKGE